MIKRIARWILRREINDLEHELWWHAGVNQGHYDPKSSVECESNDARTTQG